MWHNQAIPLLQERGLGTEVASRTFRLAGIGESQVAERLGEALLRSPNPVVATYARAEAVDVRISAVAEPPRTALALVEEASATVLDLVGDHIWATGDKTWSASLGERLTALGWRLAAVEVGTAGSFGQLIGDVEWFRFDEAIALDAPAARAHGASSTVEEEGEAEAGDLLRFARRARELGEAEVGVCLRARPRSGDTAVSIAVSTPSVERTVRRIVFLTGPLGRSRSAISAAAFLLELLDQVPNGATDRI